MNIELKKLTIINFKGIKSLEIDFSKTTNICGRNGSGKTTIFDAFTWLLFGKDSSDSSKFSVKPLTKDGRTIDKTENEVSAIITADGRTIEVKKILKEKWVKKRGEQLQVFEGNETEYSWNGVPMREKDFADKVGGIINPGIFKMITNALFFNTQMTWVDRRGVLMTLAGEISNEDIAAGNTEYNALIEQLTQKTLIDLKKEYAAKKKKLKESLEHIPARIDEVSKGMPEELDWAEINGLISEKNIEIEAIDAKINDSSKSHEATYEKIKAELKAIHNMTVDRDAIAYKIKSEASGKANQLSTDIKNKRGEIDQASRQLKNIDNEITDIKNRKESTGKDIASLREQWKTVNAEKLEFDEHEFSCPTCKREFEASDIDAKKEELTNNFMASKKSKLAAIDARGLKMKNELSGFETRIAELHEESETLTDHRGSLYTELEVLTAKLNTPGESVEMLIENNIEYRALADKIAALESSKTEKPVVDNDGLVLEKNELRNDIDKLKKQLNGRDLIAAAKKRMSVLQEEEQGLAQQLADLEGFEYLIEQFGKAKIDMMEERINGKFKLVSFKMFDVQINGGVTECCETTIKGVPFSDLNTASKINAGIDIINVLCDHYDIHAPVFIDGRESVTEIIPCDSQIINLIVKEGSPLTVDGVKAGRVLQEEAA